MKVPYEEYEQFKQSGVFSALHEDLQLAIGSLASEMLNRTEPSPHRDMYIRGFIAGLRTIFEWEPEFVKEGDEEEYDDA